MACSEGDNKQEKGDSEYSNAGDAIYLVVVTARQAHRDEKRYTRAAADDGDDRSGRGW